MLPLASRLLDTPMGPMTAVAGDSGLWLLKFDGRRMLSTNLQRVRERSGRDIAEGNHPLLDQTEIELNEYFAGTRPAFDVRLDYSGTPFQRLVWEALLRIPWGTTISYGALATRLGRPDASRAVARANGDNRIAVIIPCHRVIGADGSLTGYGGGLDRKRRLLELEASATLFSTSG